MKGILTSSTCLAVLRGNSLAEHPLFNSLIRTNVVSRAIASTHQRIPLALAGKWFDLQGAELSAFVTGELGWTVDGDVISIPANEDNNVQGKNIRETVELPRASSSSVVRPDFLPRRLTLDLSPIQSSSRSSALAPGRREKTSLSV